MGWAQRANLIAQDRRAGLIRPKLKATPPKTQSRASLAAMIREFCGLNDVPTPAPAVRDGMASPIVPRREKAS